MNTLHNIVVWLLAVALAAGLVACGAGGEAPAQESSDVADVAVAAETATPEDSWTRLDAPELPTDRRLNVAFLIVDGVYNTELTAPFDVFHHVRFHSQPGMEVFTVSPDGSTVTSFEGLRIAADYSFADAPESIEVLVVPSAEHSMDSDLENEAMIQWVAEVGEKAMFVMSLCDGAFVLAKAGLLDGLASTTFPSDQDRFAEMFPHLDLRRGVSFVHHGKAITSQGGAPSFDPAMYLADHLYGTTATQGIGRGLIIPWPPKDLPALVIPDIEDSGAATSDPSEDGS